MQHWIFVRPSKSKLEVKKNPAGLLDHYIFPFTFKLEVSRPKRMKYLNEYKVKKHLQYMNNLPFSSITQCSSYASLLFSSRLSSLIVTNKILFSQKSSPVDLPFHRSKSAITNVHCDAMFMSLSITESTHVLQGMLMQYFSCWVLSNLQKR